MSTTETEVRGTISPKDFADLVGSDPKTVRRFLRSLTTDRANKGGRWEIANDDVEALVTRWNERAKGTSFKMRTVDIDTDELEQDAVDLENEVDELDDIDEL